MNKRSLPGTWVVLLAVFAGTGCFAARGVRPVGEGRLAAGLSVGGPLFTNLGGAIPTPLATGFVRYGLTGRTDLDVGLSLPVAGAAGLDAGASHLLLEQDGLRPAVTLGGRLNCWANVYGLAGRKDANGRPFAVGARLFEEGYGYASWKPGERSLVYAGLDLFAQLEHATLRPTLLAGVEWRPARLFGLQLEIKQMAFTTNQRFATVDFLGPGDFGAFAVDLGFNFYPGAAP